MIQGKDKKDPGTRKYRFQLSQQLDQNGNSESKNRFETRQTKKGLETTQKKKSLKIFFWAI